MDWLIQGLLGGASGGQEDDEHQVVQRIPDDPNYDPKKADYITPATQKQVDDIELALLRKQIAKLTRALKHRGDRISPEVRAHYERVVIETRRQANALQFSLPNTWSTPSQLKALEPVRHFRHARLRSDPVMCLQTLDELQGFETPKASGRVPMSATSPAQLQRSRRTPGEYFSQLAVPMTLASPPSTFQPPFRNAKSTRTTTADSSCPSIGEESLGEVSMAKSNSRSCLDAEVNRTPALSNAATYAGSHASRIDQECLVGDEHLPDDMPEDDFWVPELVGVDGFDHQRSDLLDGTPMCVAHSDGYFALTRSLRKRSSACCDEELMNRGRNDSMVFVPSVPSISIRRASNVEQDVADLDNGGGWTRQLTNESLFGDFQAAESKEAPPGFADVAQEGGGAPTQDAEDEQNGHLKGLAEQRGDLSPVISRNTCGRQRALAKGISMMNMADLNPFGDDDEEDGMDFGPRVVSLSHPGHGRVKEDNFEQTPSGRRRSHCRGPSLTTHPGIAPSSPAEGPSKGSVSDPQGVDDAVLVREACTWEPPVDLMEEVTTGIVESERSRSAIILASSLGELSPLPFIGA